jgi:hypothetical protein
MTATYFDRAKAVDSGPFPMGTSPFALLARGAAPMHEAARQRVETMLARYPAQGRDALLSRLQAREVSQASDAFFELFVLNLFLHRGFKLVGVEQPLPHTAFVVDFSFETPDGRPFLVEVVSYNPPRDSVGPKKLLDDVFNAVDSVESTQFQVDVTDVLGLPTQSASKKSLKARVAGWLSSLPATELAGHAKMFTVAKGCSFTLVPRLRERTGRAGLLVAPPKGDSCHNMVEGLRRKLYQKAFKYGPLSVPLVVALNISAEMGATPALFDQAVYGPEDVGAAPKEYLGYPGEYAPSAGALLEQGGPLSQVPAVVGFLGITPFDCGLDLGAVYYGKYAAPFNLAMLGLSSFWAPDVPRFDRAPADPSPLCASDTASRT